MCKLNGQKLFGKLDFLSVSVPGVRVFSKCLRGDQKLFSKKKIGAAAQKQTFRSAWAPRGAEGGGPGGWKR